MSQNKFVEAPRHPLDFRFQKKVGRRLNGLLNAQIHDERGNVIGTVEYADGNTVFKFKSAGSDSATAAFAIMELGHQDYFIARQLSNVHLDTDTGLPVADVGAADVKIAKVKDVRRSILTEVRYGDAITYSDDDPSDIDNTRNADNGVDPTEPQVCLPPYVTLSSLGLSSTVPTNSLCLVYATKLTGLTGVFDEDGQPIDWIENAGHAGVRAFAERDPDPA